VAEQLYDVLASRAVSSRQMPVLLLANKSDCGAKAHSVEFIRKRLEKALDQLRTTRADVDAESGNVSVLLSVSVRSEWMIDQRVCHLVLQSPPAFHPGNGCCVADFLGQAITPLCVIWERQFRSLPLLDSRMLSVTWQSMYVTCLPAVCS